MSDIFPWLRLRRDEARLAFMLLSRLPMGTLANAPALSKAMWAYPLVGLVIGALVGLVLHLCVLAGLPALAGAVLALAAGLIATGALHEDGLADSADALGASTRERRLEIMKDSRIGSFGVLALVLSCALRIVFIGELAGFSAGTAIVLLAAAGAASRAPLPLMMQLLPPARADGLGRHAAEGATLRLAIMALLLGWLPLLFLAGGSGLVALTLCALTAAAAGSFFRSRIGGVTGDVLGATQILCEIMLLMALVSTMAP